MPKRLTTEAFIANARKVHGNSYLYHNVVYIQNKKPICIICPEHGEFWQRPNDHLCGKGCPTCKSESAKRLRYGVGVNDVVGGCKSPAYQIWTNMLLRCYDADNSNYRPTYLGCSVCNSWLYFSNFKTWFENPENGYMEGYHLDKDIILKNNKVYSPERCCFIPKEINSLFTNRKRLRGAYPVGIQPKDGGYEVLVDTNGERPRYIGFYYNIPDAFAAYKDAKEYRIREVATRYYAQKKITQRVYNAMLNYQIQITIVR